MNVKKNTIANYLGQSYSLAISVITLPLFFNLLGAEAYGLVGLYAVLYAWFAIFDLGMTPALGREVARLRASNATDDKILLVISTFERISLAIVFILGVTFILLSDRLAVHWLKVENLDLNQVIFSLQFLALAIALRLQTTVYKSVINGSEEQVWLNGFDIIIATLRYPLLLGIIALDPARFEWFFIGQAILSALEIVGLRLKIAKLFTGQSTTKNFDFNVIRPLLSFVALSAYTAALGIAITQYDKLILSTSLSLNDYGYFSLLAVVTAGIVALTGPISKAILPRLTAFYQQQNINGMIGLYKKATFAMVATLSPLVAVIALWPYEVIFAWSGNTHAAEWIQPVMPWFVGSTGLVCIILFQYFLQYAHGDLRYNARFSTALFLVSVPLITWSAFQYGVMGVAVVLFILRLLIFLFWVPYVHSKFVPGMHASWLRESVIAPFLITLGTYLILMAIDAFLPAADSRIMTSLRLVVFLSAGYIALLIWIKTKRPDLLASGN